jgi:hypothetical protein
MWRGSQAPRILEGALGSLFSVLHKIVLTKLLNLWGLYGGSCVCAPVNSNGGSGGMQSSMHGSRHFPSQEVISPKKKSFPLQS